MSEIPEGWQLVPTKPTMEMIRNASGDHEGESWLPHSLWASMLAAAPQPPAAVQGAVLEDTAALREALDASMKLIDRLMHVHVAPDECASYVKQSSRWLFDNGGTLACVAEQQASNRAALAAPQVVGGLRKALEAIRDYPTEGRRTADGYPSEIAYDEFAYKRMVDSYREAAAGGLASIGAA